MSVRSWSESRKLAAPPLEGAHRHHHPSFGTVAPFKSPTAGRLLDLLLFIDVSLSSLPVSWLLLLPPTPLHTCEGENMRKSLPLFFDTSFALRFLSPVPAHTQVGKELLIASGVSDVNWNHTCSSQH